LDTIRPVILSSRCLGFASCRYNGQTITDDFVEKLKPYVDFITICPEVEIGLGIPRDPIRLVLQGNEPRLLQPATGQDVTEAMQRFCQTFLDQLDVVDGFLLKHRSPSCGPHAVRTYHSKNLGAGFEKGMGYFAHEIACRFPGFPMEEEGRLKDYTIREHFLTSLFALTDFRKVKEARSMKDLIDFHSRSKLLLLAYHQSKMREMGRLLASHRKESLEDLTREYEVLLRQALVKPPRQGSVINTFQHAFGGVSDHLSDKERIFFLNKIEEYRDERIPMSILGALLQSWALRLEKHYLLNQRFFFPYPEGLCSVRDSGKGLRK